jgi:hypothetical protein
MKKTSISDYAEFKKFCQISSEDDKILEELPRTHSDNFLLIFDNNEN